MTECGYVWMAPVRAPGNAHDKGGHLLLMCPLPTLPAAEQFFFDYIIPTHPDAAPHIQKLFGPGADGSVDV